MFCLNLMTYFAERLHTWCLYYIIIILVSYSPHYSVHTRNSFLQSNSVGFFFFNNTFSKMYLQCLPLETSSISYSLLRSSCSLTFQLRRKACGISFCIWLIPFYMIYSSSIYFTASAMISFFFFFYLE